MKIALITGASQGIGASIAKILNKAKIKVILVARSRKNLKQIQKNLTYPKYSKIISKDLRSLSAFSSNKIRKYEVEDTAIVNFIFKSGALGTLSVSDTIVSPWSYELTAGENPAYPVTDQSAYYIGGTKSSIQFPNYKEWYNKNERSWWKKIYHQDSSTRDSRYTLVNQIDHLCDVVAGKAKPKVTGNDGLQSLKIFAAIIKSSKTGKKIKV